MWQNNKNQERNELIIQLTMQNILNSATKDEMQRKAPMKLMDI